MADNLLPNVKDDYVVGRYLSPAQILEVLKKIDGVSDIEKQFEAVDLIHRFVISNGKADKDYMMMYEALCSLNSIYQSESDDFKLAKPGCALGYSTLLISLFMMVEVLPPEEFAELEEALNKKDNGNQA